MTDLTDDDARRQLRTVQLDIEAALRDRAHAEGGVADIDQQLVELRSRERILLEQLTPERAGVPRVIRKG